MDSQRARALASNVPNLDKFPDLRKSFINEVGNSNCTQCNVTDVIRSYVYQVQARMNSLAESKPPPHKKSNAGPQSTLRKLQDGTVRAEPGRGGRIVDSDHRLRSQVR